jgi:hypothetical protein
MVSLLKGPFLDQNLHFLYVSVHDKGTNLSGDGTLLFIGKKIVLYIKISPICGVEVMVDVHGTPICNVADPEPEEFGLFKWQHLFFFIRETSTDQYTPVPDLPVHAVVPYLIG